MNKRIISKLVSVVLAGAMTLSVAGCGSNAKEANNSETIRTQRKQLKSVLFNLDLVH